MLARRIQRLQGGRQFHGQDLDAEVGQEPAKARQLICGQTTTSLRRPKAIGDLHRPMRGRDGSLSREEAWSAGHSTAGVFGQGELTA